MKIIPWTVILSLIITFSCTNISNTNYPPQFKVSNDSVYATINKILKTDSISIEGARLPIDDTFDICMLIRLVNVDMGASNNDTSLANQKKIAKTLKYQLKNISQYQKYYIWIVKLDTTKSTIGTVFKNDGLSLHDFNSDDL